MLPVYNYLQLCCEVLLGHCLRVIMCLTSIDCTMTTAVCFHLMTSEETVKAKVGLSNCFLSYLVV